MINIFLLIGGIVALAGVYVKYTQPDSFLLQIVIIAVALIFAIIGVKKEKRG